MVILEVIAVSKRGGGGVANVLYLSSLPLANTEAEMNALSWGGRGGGGVANWLVRDKITDRNTICFT